MTLSTPVNPYAIVGVPWSTGNSGPPPLNNPQPNNTLDFTLFLNSIYGVRSGRPKSVYTDAVMTITNDSDSALLFTWTTAPQTNPIIIEPGGYYSGPIATGGYNLMWQVQYQNPFQTHPNELFIIHAYTPEQVKAGVVSIGLRTTVNPSTPAAGVGPGTLPVNVGFTRQFNILYFGADPTGVLDSTAAFLNAVSAIAAIGGGILFIPPGLYVTSACIVIGSQFIIVQGSGWNTIIKPVAGATFDVFATGLIPYGGANSPNDLQGLQFRDFVIDGSNMTGTAAGQGNGIHFWGARQSFISFVKFMHMPNYCVILEGSSTGGYNDTVRDCEMDSNCAGGIWIGNGNEADWILNNEIIGCAQTLAAAQPAFGVQNTVGNLLNSQAGISSIEGNVFGGGASSGTMNPGVLLSNEGHRFRYNRFDTLMNTALKIAGSGGKAGMIIHGNEFKDSNTVVAGPSMAIDASYCNITNNVWILDSPPAHYNWNIQEQGNPLTNNYAFNVFRVKGTAGSLSQNVGSTNNVFDNINI